MYFDFELHDAYRPRMLSKSEWTEWARYSFHHTTSTSVKQFLRYLDKRKKLSGATRLPTQDIVIESLMGNSYTPFAFVLQEVRDDSLKIDFVSVCLDGVENPNDRLPKIAKAMTIAREFSLRMKIQKAFPHFKSIILHPTLSGEVLKAASTLTEVFKVFEPTHGEQYRFELKC